MSHEVTKNKTNNDNESINNTFDRVFSYGKSKGRNKCSCNNTDGSLNTNSQAEEYFDIKIQKKYYPSCYQYNVLIMLAKKLIKQEKENSTTCNDRVILDEKLASRIISSL